MISNGVKKVLRPSSGPLSSKRSVKTASESWYKDGLKFSCTGCGTTISLLSRQDAKIDYLLKQDWCQAETDMSYIWIWKKISSKLEIEPKAFLKKFARWVPRIERWTLNEKTRGDNFDCIFLENGKTCAIYDVRPTQCKTYPYWPAVMESKETWESEKQDCEGIGRDDTYVTTAEQITQTLEKQKRDTEKTYEMGKKPTF